MQRMQPTVAVIVPCHNAAGYIEDTLDSVLAQTLPPQVVVVDDGSTDETATILRSYADRVRVLRHDGGSNRGVAESRNLGIATTTSPYLAFLDADDLWHPGKLALEAQVLDEHPEVGVVVSGCRAIDARNEYLYDFPPFPSLSDHDLPAALLLDCFIQTPGQVLIRRSVLETVGVFDPELTAAEDHDLWVRLAERTRFMFLTDRTVSYRKHSASLSNAGAARMWQSGFALLAKAERRRNYGTTATRRLAVLHYRLAQCAWWEGAYVRAVVATLRACLLDPRRAWHLHTGRAPEPREAPADGAASSR